MPTPHLQRKQCALNLDDFGGHVIQMLLLVAIEVGIGIIGYDGICRVGARIRNWLTGYEAGEPFG
jgi:hypothetical protein